MSTHDLQRIREARSRFAAMATSYFMGTFNDNLFKKAVMILAVTAGARALQSLSAALYTLPFVLLAAPAGWMADRFPKRNVVILAKGLEILAAVGGGLEECAGNLPLMAVMLGLMGVQATLFSPALNGAIPELYPEDYVTRANGMLRTVVTVGILGGTALAGFVLARKAPGAWGVPEGRLILAAMVVGVALVGFLVSLAIPSRPAADPGRPFPWSGPLDTLRTLKTVAQDRLLIQVVVADGLVWALGVIQLLLVDQISLRQFALGEKVNGILSAAQLLGIAAGALVAGKLASGPRWHRVLVPACGIMALAMALVALAPAVPSAHLTLFLGILLFAAGVGAGLFLIPSESFIQVRPAAEVKGTVWASANFLAFLGMSFAAGLAWLLNRFLLPSNSFALLALGVAGLALPLHRLLSKER